MIPYQSAKHQSGFSVPSKVLRFFKRKQHFLRLGIRGLVVRLQQESTLENSTRLITDWTIKLVQCKVIPNQDQIWHMRRFCSLEFGHFRMSKPNSFHWIRSGRKAELGQRQFVQHSSMAQAAADCTEGWDPPRAVTNWDLHQGSAHILTLARLKDWAVSSQVSPFLDRLLWMQTCPSGSAGLPSASCARQTGNWGQILQHLSWNVKPQPKDYSCTIFWWALPPQ